MDNDPRRTLSRPLNTFGGSAGNDGGGEPHVPHHHPAQYGGNSGAGRLTLVAYDPNMTRERPVRAHGGEYNMFHRGDGWESSRVKAEVQSDT